MERVTSTSQTEEKIKLLFTHSNVIRNPYDHFFLGAQKVIFLKNILDHMMRAGGEGIFVVIDVRDADIEEEIYQKWTHVLRQKNLQISDVIKDCMFGTVKSYILQMTLTIVHPSCGPMSLKYKIAEVPIGRFCSTPSSLSAFPSKNENS